MKKLFILGFSLVINLSVFAEDLPRTEINDTINILLDGQVKGASLEHFDYFTESAESEYTLKLSDKPADLTHLMEVTIKGKGKGYLVMQLILSKGYQQSCAIRIKDSAELDAPIVEKLEECTKNWQITPVSGQDNTYEFTIYAN